MSLDSEEFSNSIPDDVIKPSFTDTQATPSYEEPPDVSQEIPGTLTFRQKLSKILHSSKEDIQESNNRFRSAALGIAALGTQILDRASVSLVLVPTVATEVLNSTHQALPVGLAAAGAFFVWNATVGEVLTNALAEYPEAVKDFQEEFPSVVNVFSESLPGLEEIHEAEPQFPESTLKSIGKKASLHMRRAGTGIGIGSTAFVATASAKGESKATVRRINLAVSTDTGFLVGGIAGGVAQAIISLSEHGQTELANEIKSTATDMRVWYGLAIVSMASEYIRNRRKRKQNQYQKLEE